MLLNIIPLISNETINKFLCYLQGFLNEGFIPDFLKFLFLLFIIALVYLFGFS